LNVVAGQRKFLQRLKLEGKGRKKEENRGKILQLILWLRRLNKKETNSDFQVKYFLTMLFNKLLFMGTSLNILQRDVELNGT